MKQEKRKKEKGEETCLLILNKIERAGIVQRENISPVIGKW
jgi:hypothetical protein